MNQRAEESLIEKINSLSPERRAEVEDFVNFLTAEESRRAALDRLLAIAPALEAAGVAPMSEDEIAAEVQAAPMRIWSSATERGLPSMRTA